MMHWSCSQSKLFRDSFILKGMCAVNWNDSRHHLVNWGGKCLPSSDLSKQMCFLNHMKNNLKKSQLIETTFDLWHFFLWNVFTEHCSGFIIKWRIRGAYQCPQMSFPKWIGETLVKIANISEANFPKHLLASHQFHFPRTSPLGKSTRV